MDVKKRIGQRIAATRKKLGLTKVALAEKSGFGASRLGNWESGIRTPKLADMNTLADILGVASTYLLCLADNEDGSLENNYKSISLFNENSITPFLNGTPNSVQETLPLAPFLEPILEQDPIALRLYDNSMSPMFHQGNILIFLQKKEAKHNDIVLASMTGLERAVVRKYFIDTSDISNISIKLIPLNDEWVTNTATDKSSIIIHGVLSNSATVFF